MITKKMVCFIFVLLIPAFAAASLLSSETFEGPCRYKWYQGTTAQYTDNFVGTDFSTYASGSCSNVAFGDAKNTSIYKDTSVKYAGNASMRLYPTTAGLGATSEFWSETYPSGTDEIWVSWYERISSNYYIDAGHKWMLVKMAAGTKNPDGTWECNGNNTSDCYLNWQGDDGVNVRRLSSRIYHELRDPEPQGHQIFANVRLTLPSESWYRVKMHVKLNSFTGTTPNDDGEFNVWYNFGSGWIKESTLGDYVKIDDDNPDGAADLEHLILRTTSANYIRAVRFGGTRSLTTYDSTGNRWFDNILVGTTEADVDSAASSTIINISATDDSASEQGTATGAVAVTCSGTCPGTASVAITRSGTADYGAGSDYTDNLSTPITSFPTTITLTPVDDAENEATETATYTGACTNCSFSSSQATINILDNDTTTTVTVTATDSLATEESTTTGTFRFSRGALTSGDLTVNYTISGTATNGTDHSTLSGAATIANGNSYVDVTVTPIDDSTAESNEYVVVSIASGSYTIGSPSTAQVTIEDNDTASQSGVVFSDDFEDLSQDTIDEWTWLTTDAVSNNWRCMTGACDYYHAIGDGYRANLSYAANPTVGTSYLPTHHAHSGSYAPVWVARYNEARGQAYVKFTNQLPSTTNNQSFNDGFQELYVRMWNYYTGDDGTYQHAYQAKHMRINSVNSSGTAAVEMVFQPLNNDSDNANEGFKLAANSPPIDWGAVYGGTTIPDNTWVCYELHYKLNTPGSADGIAEMWMDLGDGAGAVKRVSKTDITFQGPSDSYKLNNVLVGGWWSNNGVNSYQNNYRYMDDVVISTERIGCGDTPPPATALVTISANDPDAYEQGTDTAVVTITCSGTGCATASVPVTRGGTATVTTDYSDDLSSPVSTFPTTITLTPVDDEDDESSETATYTLGTCTNCTKANSSSTVTIYDNDSGSVYVTVTATDSEASEEGSAIGTFRVSRDSTSGDLSVNVSLAGTATAGSDYTTISSPVVIEDGDSYTDVTVTPIDDSDGAEPWIEDVTMTIGIGAGYEVGIPTSATVSIQSNDNYPYADGLKFSEGSFNDYSGISSDTYINSGAATTNYSNTGLIKLYTWPAGISANISILKYDLSAIAPGTIITYAYLYLDLIGYEGVETVPYYVSAHRIINHNPIVTTATWNTYDGSNSWTVPGLIGDVTTADDTTSVGILPGVYSWDVTYTVQQMVNNPSSNYGIALTSNISGYSQGVDQDRIFAGALYPDLWRRPVLVVKVGEAPPVEGTGQITFTAGGGGRITMTSGGAGSITAGAD